MVTKLVDFRKDKTHITICFVLSKAGTKLENGEFSGGLMIYLSKALEFFTETICTQFRSKYITYR